MSRTDFVCFSSVKTLSAAICLRTSGGYRPSDNGGPGHPDPEIKGGGLKKIFFSTLRASVWSKNKGGGLGPSPGSTTTKNRLFLSIPRNRENIERELFKALARRVDGCCRETCPPKEGDMPPCGYCITNALCKSNQKGIFVEVRYFQLLEVDVHEDVKSRYLRQVTEAAEEERAEFEL